MLACPPPLEFRTFAQLTPFVFHGVLPRDPWDMGFPSASPAAEGTMPAMARAFMRIRLTLLPLVAAGCLGSAWAQTPDPLPSWNDGPVKKSITDFVPRVTTPGGADF